MMDEESCRPTGCKRGSPPGTTKPSAPPPPATSFPKPQFQVGPMAHAGDGVHSHPSLHRRLDEFWALGFSQGLEILGALELGAWSKAFLD